MLSILQSLSSVKLVPPVLKLGFPDCVKIVTVTIRLVVVHDVW